MKKYFQSKCILFFALLIIIISGVCFVSVKVSKVKADDTMMTQDTADEGDSLANPDNISYSSTVVEETSPPYRRSPIAFNRTLDGSLNNTIQIDQQIRKYKTYGTGVYKAAVSSFSIPPYSKYFKLRKCSTPDSGTTYRPLFWTFPVYDTTLTNSANLNYYLDTYSVDGDSPASSAVVDSTKYGCPNVAKSLPSMPWTDYGQTNYGSPWYSPYGLRSVTANFCSSGTLNIKTTVNGSAYTGTWSLPSSLTVTGPDFDRLNWSSNGTIIPTDLASSALTNAITKLDSGTSFVSGTYSFANARKGGAYTVSYTGTGPNGSTLSSITGNGVTFSCTGAAGKDVTLNFTATVSTPATPTNLTATPGACGTGTITVSWTASTGATSYTLKDGSTVLSSSITGTSYSHTGLTTGSSHSYTIAATNTSGTSDYSSAVSATAPAECPAALSCSLTVAPSSGVTPLSSILSAGGSGGTSPYTYKYNCTTNGSYTTTSSCSYTTAGSYTAYGQVTDSASTTATCSTSVSASTPVPNLITLNLARTPTTTIVAGNSVSFSGQVKNSGTANAVSSYARFCVDNSSCTTTSTGIVGSDVATVALNSGATSSTLSSTTSWTAASGTHTIYFCADAGTAPGAVSESSEADNCTHVSITVEAASTIDLYGNPVSDASGTTAGTARTYHATISNIGNTTTGAGFSYFFQTSDATGGAGTTHDLTSSTSTALAANATTSSLVSPSVSFSANGSIRICANKSNSNTNLPPGTGGFTESDWTNNCGAWVDVGVSLQPPVISATSDSTCGIDISWTASAGATGYNVYRSTISGSGYEQIGSVENSPFRDVTAIKTTTYYYVVQAVDSIGGTTSGTSNEASSAATKSCIIEAGRCATKHYGCLDFVGPPVSSNTATHTNPNGVENGKPAWTWDCPGLNTTATSCYELRKIVIEPH